MLLFRRRRHCNQAVRMQRYDTASLESIKKISFVWCFVPDILGTHRLTISMRQYMTHNLFCIGLSIIMLLSLASLTIASVTEILKIRNRSMSNSCLCKIFQEDTLHYNINAVFSTLLEINVNYEAVKKLTNLTEHTRGNNWWNIQVSTFCSCSGIIFVNLPNTAVSKNLFF